MSGHYNETQVRHEFIDPFFKALGWDVNNEQGYAESYKDVVHEDSIKVGGATKAPDYCFRVGGTRKFYVEAKRPGVNIKDNADGAFQIRRYAWSSKLPLSILTDFEEFAVYDCRIKPAKTDKASAARTLSLHFTDYAPRWDELASVFSRDAVLKGSFDKYADSTKAKKGTAEVDDALLAEIESWRDVLAHNLALRNPGLTRRELNFAVQSTIDRIIFLRICEDRGIEEYGRLMALQNGTRVYERLGVLFQRADERYNSGLFHFHREKGRTELPDELTLGLVLDDKPLKDIFKSLYYPDSPYEFSVLPANILGHVYEQFLGKVIRLTEGHHAVIEDKPEVKKAGGVYYTPTYIVDYIVKQTVGKLLEGRRPGPRGSASQLKIIDPACGSGSFLIGAYQYLLDWHRDQYVADGTKKHTRELYQGPGGDWRLTTGERKRILLNNIYGVDIDAQAVETTKLSLLLKVLEGESEQTVSRQLAMFHERALPDLANNIKCGNSLIGPDFYDNRQASFLDEEARYRVNVFDWQTEFPEVFRGDNPGFGAVIGNPPYGAAASPEQVLYFRHHYASCSGSADSFALFMDKGSALLRAGGILGMIVQSAWVSAPSFRALRELFASCLTPLAFATMPYDVFGAYVDTVVAVAERLPQGKTMRSLATAPVDLVVFPPRFKVRSVDDFATHSKAADAVKWIADECDEFLITLSDAERVIVGKIRTASGKFSDVADIQRGVTPFHTTPGKPAANPCLAFTGVVRRYKLEPGETAFIRFDDTLAEYKPPRYFRGPRILLRELISRQFRLQAVYADEDFVTNKSMQSLLLAAPQYALCYLLGLLNSRLMSWYFLAVHSVGRRDDFPKIVLKQTRDLPFRKIDLADDRDKTRHDQMVVVVQQMLDLHKQLAAANLAQEKTALQRQIDAVDRQIDAMVYQLYDLTDEEIAVVERVGGKP